MNLIYPGVSKILETPSPPQGNDRMPMPNLLDTADKMLPEEVRRWIETVKLSGLASTDVEIAALIGKSVDTLGLMKKRGADRTTALACNAVLSRVPPYKNQGMTMNRYKVAMPVTLTIEVDAHSPGDIEHVIGETFAYKNSNDPLEGIKFVLPAINVQNAMIMTCALAKDFDTSEFDIEELYPVVKRQFK